MEIGMKIILKSFGRGGGKDRTGQRYLMSLPVTPQPLPFYTEIMLRSVSPLRSATKRRVSRAESHIFADTVLR